MAHLRGRYERQTTLNQAIAKIDKEIDEFTRRCEILKGSSYITTYTQSREMLSFYSSRRRYLLRRLITIQIKEFIR